MIDTSFFLKYDFIKYKNYGVEMKKSLLLMAIMLFSINTYAIHVNANCYANSYDATCSIYNQWATPIICSGTATAVTQQGFRYYTYMNNEIIFPGNYRYMYIRSYNYYSPFVFSWANLNCSWW